MNVADAWAKLDKALTGLEKAGEGRVARMNHRKKALTALRTLRSAIDEEYPAVAKKVRRRKTPISPSERERKLIAKGWIDIHRKHEAMCLRCKLPHRRTGTTPDELYVPKWVAMAFKEGKTESQLKSIKKSRTEQRALNTLWVATEGGER